MFEPSLEVRMAAGYLLTLSVGVVYYMRFTFPRAATDVAAKSSIARILVTVGWGVTIAADVVWPDLPQYWNFFMFPVVRWFTVVPAAIGILFMIWAMRSHLRLDDNGNVAASGPYVWCRYPFDTALAVFFVSVTLLCANWLIIAITLVFILLHRVGVPHELERVRRIVLGPAYDAYAAQTGWFLPSAAPVKKARYQVPSRFSLTAIMGLLTVLAIIFGSLKAAEAPPVVYLFVGSEIVAICLVQILVGAAPRSGSTLTGAVLLPFWVYLTLRTPALPAMLDFLLAIGLVGFGGLMGYCIGALAAGFFLIMDLVEPWLLRDRTAYELPGPEFSGVKEPDRFRLTPHEPRKAVPSWRVRRS